MDDDTNNVADDPGGPPWRWLAGWALVGTLAAAALALGPLDGVPHVQDEIVYQFQARLLSEGRLWDAEITPRAAYHFEFIINEDGRRWGVFPNGWPLVLAVGTLLGVPWLINPLLHGLTVLVGGLLAYRVREVRAARIVSPLLAICPALVLLAASRMSHTLCALLALISVYLVLTREPSTRSALLVGAGVGFLLLTRPLDAVIVGIVVGGLAVWRSRRASLRWWPAAIPVAVALLLVAGQNALLTGDWATLPQQYWFAHGKPPVISGFRYTDVCNSLGFGDEKGCFATFGSYGHTVPKAAASIRINTDLALQLWFGAWPLALLCVPAFFNVGRGRALAVATGVLWAVLMGAYALYWYHGACYGARFYHSAAPLAVILLGLGTERLLRLRDLPWLLGLVPLLVFGWRLSWIEPELQRYWAVDDRLHEVVDNWDGEPAVLFVAYDPHEHVGELRRTAQFIRYTPFLRRGMWVTLENPRIHFAEFHPEVVAAVRRKYPDRPAYVLMLASKREDDRLIPLSKLPPLPPQVDDLEIPQPMPLLQLREE